MSQLLLTRYIPGWEKLSPMEFRWALNEVDAPLRPELRQAHHTALTAGEPTVAPSHPDSPPVPVPAYQRRKAHPASE